MIHDNEVLTLFKTYLVKGSQANQMKLPKEVGILIVQYAQLEDRTQDVMELLNFLAGKTRNDNANLEFVSNLKKSQGWVDQELNESLALLEKWTEYSLRQKYEVYSNHYHKILRFLLSTPFFRIISKPCMALRCSSWRTVTCKCFYQ